MWQGRTQEQKKLLVEGITEAFAKIGTPAEKVTVILKDNPKNNWAEGGKLASEGP
jgi:4-oxalocrotonate tautomerase